MNSRTPAAFVWGMTVAAPAAAWLFAEPLTARQGVGALLLGAAMLVLLALRRPTWLSGLSSRT